MHTWWKHIRYFARLQTPVLKSDFEAEGVRSVPYYCATPETTMLLLWHIL